MVTIVTGAAGGIGRLVTLGLLDSGHRVVAVDIPRAERQMEELVSAAEGVRAKDRLFPAFGDVTSPDACESIVRRTIEHFGRVDALINNAALFVSAFYPRAFTNPPKFHELTPESWQTIVNTNVNGPFLMARAVTPHLLKQKWGRIVNVVTSYGTMTRGGVSPYGPSKAALEAATAVWSEDLDGTGVTVNALLPGRAADTAMIQYDDVRDRKTLLSPSVMVAPAVWLISPDSDGITGHRFIAKDWDPAKPWQENVRTAGALAAWRSTSALTG